MTRDWSERRLPDAGLSRHKRAAHFSRLLGLAALIALPTIAAGPAQAGCGDRPGTPTDVSAKPISSSSIKFNWRDTTKAGEIPLGPFYDIEVTDKNGNGQPQGVTGQGYLFGGKLFEHLDFNKMYCFRVKARTEQGTKGCVSLNWSARVCATTPVPPLSSSLKTVPGKGPWAAVAATGDGFWGFQIDGKSRDQAEKDARNGCGSAASRCDKIRSMKAKCLAYATSNQSGFHFGVGLDDVGTDATTAAMKQCGKNAPVGSCKLVDAMCRAQ